MDLRQEYVGPYRWDEARERIPNDYRTNDDPINEYEGFKSKEEEAEYWDKNEEMMLDNINPIY